MVSAPLETQRNFVNRNVWSAGINQDVTLRSAEMRPLLAEALRKAHPGLVFPRMLGNSDAPKLLLDLPHRNEVTDGRAASRLSIAIGKAELSRRRWDRPPGPQAPVGLDIPGMCAIFMLGGMVGAYVRRGARAQSVHS